MPRPGGDHDHIARRARTARHGGDKNFDKIFWFLSKFLWYVGDPRSSAVGRLVVSCFCVDYPFLGLCGGAACFRSDAVSGAMRSGDRV